jgi:hypothetical protein
MKTTLILLTTALLVIGAPAASLALDVGDGILDLCQLQWVRDHRDGLGTLAPGFPVLASPSGVQWMADSPGSGSWEIQIGDAYDTPTTGAGMLNCYLFPKSSGLLDWSGYSTFSMTFHNNSLVNSFSIQLMINTGATGLGEPNNLYYNDWQVVPPGGSAVVSSLDLSGVANLNHVSNVSFKMMSDADHIDVTAVAGETPVPTALTTWGALKSRFTD